MYGGGLVGCGKDCSDMQGINAIKVGDKIGVLAKAGDHGYVRFFRNGKEFGGGFRDSAIKGPLVIAVQTFNPGDCYEIVPNAAEPIIHDGKLCAPV